VTVPVTSGSDAADSRGAAAPRVDQGSDYGGEPGRAALADSLGTRLGPAATFATTEHFNLQTARVLTVTEANGRASIYLAALSGNLIALAFVGQMSRLGAAFYAFALILLPVLAFVGVVTFLRRQRHGGLPGEVADARRPATEPPDHRAPRRVGERNEHAVEHCRILSHAATYRATTLSARAKCCLHPAQVDQFQPGFVSE
jgi:hypothetical protein